MFGSQDTRTTTPAFRGLDAVASLSRDKELLDAVTYKHDRKIFLRYLPLWVPLRIRRELKARTGRAFACEVAVLISFSLSLSFALFALSKKRAITTLRRHRRRMCACGRLIDVTSLREIKFVDDNTLLAFPFFPPFPLPSQSASRPFSLSPYLFTFVLFYFFFSLRSPFLSVLDICPVCYSSFSTNPRARM